MMGQTKEKSKKEESKDKGGSVVGKFVIYFLFIICAITIGDLVQKPFAEFIRMIIGEGRQLPQSFGTIVTALVVALMLVGLEKLKK